MIEMFDDLFNDEPLMIPECLRPFVVWGYAERPDLSNEERAGCRLFESDGKLEHIPKFFDQAFDVIRNAMDPNHNLYALLRKHEYRDVVDELDAHLFGHDNSFYGFDEGSP